MSQLDRFFNSGGQAQGGTKAISTFSPAPVTRNLYSPPAVVDPLVSQTVDELWGANYDGSAPNNYLDYYFSGADIKLTIDGTEGWPTYNNLPLCDIQFRVAQQKQVVYGFWSYVADAVIRGTRIVNGTFSIYTRSPNYMIQTLALAAQTRSTNNGSVNYYYFKPLTQDDANIQQYWGNNMDQSLQAGTDNAINIFSGHPPFTFIITYGVQNMSTGGIGDFSQWTPDNNLLVDTNERLIDAGAGPSTPMRAVLEACELTSMTTIYDPSGAPIKEQYEFFARDYFPLSH